MLKVDALRMMGLKGGPSCEGPSKEEVGSYFRASRQTDIKATSEDLLAT